MTSKSVVSIIAFLIAVSNLWGQTKSFAPIGARWLYRPHELTFPDSRLYAFTVTQDTLLDGLLASELLCTQWVNGQFQDFPDLNKYVYANSDSVWYRVDNHWELLFDFGALPGDTIRSKVEFFGIFNGCIGPDPGQVWDVAYTIDSIGIETIGGAPLRVQYVRNLCPNTDECWSVGGWGLPGKIVERIGSVELGYWWGQGSACLLGGFPGYLRCYEDAQLSFVGNIGNTACDLVSTNEIDAYNVSISPNPTSGTVNFSFSPLRSDLAFRVFDTLGRTLETGTLTAGDTALELRLQACPSGLLYIEFAAEGQSRTYKVVKM
jgi:hypothetical protein